MLINSQKLVIQIISTLIFLNLTIYFPGAGFFPFPAYLLDISIFLFIILFYLKKKLPLPLGNIFFIWLLYFITINITYYLFSSNGIEEFTYFKVIIFLLFVYIYMIFLFALDDENLTTTRITLVYLAPIATITLGIDYFNPGFFRFDADYMVIQGRAASLYRNANYAGSSMIIFLILGIDMIDKRFRIVFLLIIFLGIFFTMSRSNLMSFFLIIMIMFFQKKLNAKHLFLSFTLIIMFFIWLSTSGLNILSQQYNLEVTDNMKSRVDFFADTKSSDTNDMDERKQILQDALDIYMSNPIFGAGFATTLMWEHPVGPHNTFAMLWADQGLFGLLLIPLLFFFSTYHIFKYGTKEQKQLAQLFIVAYSLSCFFSHDRLSETTVIGFMVVISTVGYKMKQFTLMQQP